MKKETWGHNNPGRYLLELRRILALRFIQIMMRFYELSWERELNPKTSSGNPVLIEDRVFIGTRSII